jgi:hypothetical protein
MKEIVDPNMQLAKLAISTAIAAPQTGTVRLSKLALFG